MKALLLIPATAALTAIAVYVIDAERSYRRLAKHLGPDHGPVYRTAGLGWPERERP